MPCYVMIHYLCCLILYLAPGTLGLASIRTLPSYPCKMLFLKEQLYPSFVVEVLASQSRLSQHVSRTVLPSAPPKHRDFQDANVAPGPIEGPWVARAAALWQHWWSGNSEMQPSVRVHFMATPQRKTKDMDALIARQSNTSKT